MNAHHSDARKQRGIYLILTVFPLVLLLGIFAFGVDFPRRDNATAQLQAVLDSSVLTAVKQLNGTLQAIEDAREIIDSAITENTFDGAAEISFNKDEDVVFGFYSKVTCINLPTGCTSARCRACDKQPDKAEIFFFEELDPRGQYSGLPSRSLINAMKVKADVKVRGSFTNFFNAEDTGTVSITSAATTDSTTEECVFPLAIPACHLFLNTDPNDLSTLQLEDWSPRAQCPREIIFSESSLWDPWVYESRGYGYQRALMPIDQEPVFNNKGVRNRCGMLPGERGPNCMMQPIPGILALPRAFGDAHKTEVENLIDAFVQMEKASGDKACFKVSIGDEVRPIDNSTDDADGLLTGGFADKLEESLAALLNASANPRFIDVFGDPEKSTAQPNYPYLRSGSHRLLRWPTYTNADKILLEDMGEWQWTAPLCHNPSIPANDRASARVREVNVMLVVPSSVMDLGTDLTPYCDFRSQFLGGAIAAWPPYSYTRPRVIGFLKVNLFDLNFRNLGDAANKVPTADGRGSLCLIDEQQGLYDEACVSEHVLDGLSDGGPLGMVDLD